MATGFLFPIRRIPRQGSIGPRCVFLPIHHEGPTHVEPAPSQLLRFALTGTTQPRNRDGPPASGPDILDQHLKDLFSDDWPSNTPLPSPSWTFLQTTASPYNEAGFQTSLTNVHSLQDLQIFAEKMLNSKENSESLQMLGGMYFEDALWRYRWHHSYKEMLSFLNAIISRVEAHEASTIPAMHEMGMIFAYLASSEEALLRHIKAYLTVTSKPLSHKWFRRLATAISMNMELLMFRGLQLNPKKILTLVTGYSVGGQNSRYSLYEFVNWTQIENDDYESRTYIFVLTVLRNETLLRMMWDKLVETLRNDPRDYLFYAAYNCVACLITTGDRQSAMAYMERLSNHFNGTLPNISRYARLDTILSDPEISEAFPQLVGQKEYVDVLERQLNSIEKRLGISWDPENMHHTSIVDPSCIATDQSLLTINGESAGYDSIERLVAEILALGCSKYLGDLKIIADLLDDCEGKHAAVSLPDYDGPSCLEFSWYPQRSPIEFADISPNMKSDVSKPWPRSDLGLIRARPDNKGISSMIEFSMHFMQVGYLAMRSSMPNKVGADKTYRWEETGFIVVWDRVAGQFLAVHVGQSHGLVNHSIKCQGLSSPPGFQPIMKIVLPEILPLGTQDFALTTHIRATRFYLDADPASDLMD